MAGLLLLSKYKRQSEVFLWMLFWNVFIPIAVRIVCVVSVCYYLRLRCRSQCRCIGMDVILICKVHIGPRCHGPQPFCCQLHCLWCESDTFQELWTLTGLFLPCRSSSVSANTTRHQIVRIDWHWCTAESIFWGQKRRILNILIQKQNTFPSLPHNSSTGRPFWGGIRPFIFFKFEVKFPLIPECLTPPPRGWWLVFYKKWMTVLDDGSNLPSARGREKILPPLL